MKSEKSSRILSLIILTYPLLDIIYTINTRVINVNVPINQGVRFLIMIYLFIQIKNRKSFAIISLLFFLLVGGELAHLYGGYQMLGGNIAYVTKILFIVIVIYGVEDMLKSGKIDSYQLINSMVISSVIISFSIILSKFGLGYDSWEGGRSGVKGLFMVQNTITATLLVILPLCLIMFERTNKIRYLLNYSLIFVSLIMIGTKSGLAGALLISALQISVWFFKTKLNYLKLALGSMFIVLIIVLSLMSMDIFLGFINEQKGMYNTYNYNNIYSFLVSNRDLQIIYLEDYIANFRDFNPSLLFGLGYSFANEIINNGKSNFQAIEMDFYGIYYYSGIWVLILVCIIIIKRYLSLIVLVFKSKFNFMYFSIFLSISIGLFHAFYGGHVLYEALASLYFAVVLSVSRVEGLANRKSKIPTKE